MTNIKAILSLAAVAVLAAACNDGAPASPRGPVVPPPTTRSGMIIGTLDPVTRAITFSPAATSGSYAGSVSPSNYGNQGVTVQLSGVVDSIVTVSTSNKIWYVHLALQNLLGYGIGSNYTAASPPDTDGVFLYFVSDPVVTTPSNCASCTVTLKNYQGMQSFSATNQKYYWYHIRLQANQATLVSDTGRANPQWQFQANSDQVNGFTFVLMVNADFAPPNETSWSTSWVAATDSLPDDNGAPDWHEYAVHGDAVLGSDSMVTLNGKQVMELRAKDNNYSIYMSRWDDLIDSSVTVNAVLQTQATGENMSTIQGVFGISEPATTGKKQAFVGVAGNVVEFVSFAEGTGVWSRLSGPATCTTAPCSNTQSATHSYSLRKYRKDSVDVCVDNKMRLHATYAQLQGTQPSFDSASVTFGTRSSTATDVVSYWTSLNYTIAYAQPGSIGADSVCH